ncbi:MAG: AgmX/PglI C-terminal domain-containing protein [Chitinispirillaceae bacterium]|nr:AgmX/PglI C-terminal domain-containing protein [Chitinispirillaceae bacterium]
MKTFRMMVGAGIMAVAAGLVSCGKKTPETPAIISGQDTLFIAQIARLDPVEADQPVHLRNVGIRLLCAGGLPGNSSDSVVGLFSERLLLVTGVEWNRDAAALLLNASVKLQRSVVPWSCDAGRQRIDSLRSLLSVIVKSGSGASAIPSFQCDSANTTGEADRVSFFQTVLGVQPECAGLITEFLAVPDEQQPLADGSDMKTVISGLVAKKGASPESVSVVKSVARAKNATVRTPVATKDNSAAVLRYRNQESIRDSVGKHIPNLRELYKKSLKSGDSFSGKVVVTIRVNAAGDVIQTVIKATTIDNKLFLDPFMQYVRTIKFKPVAKNLGAMTFDFPFEFNAEM